MKKSFSLLLCFVIATSFLSAQEETVKRAGYNSEEGHDPAVIEVSKLDPASTILEFEEQKGVYHRAYLYFIKPNGEEWVKEVSTYTVPVYEWFANQPDLLNQYERLEIYFNGKRDSSPFNTGFMNVKFTARPFVETPITGTLEVKENGEVVPAEFDMEQVRGADLVWVEMEHDEPVSIKVSRTNPERGLQPSSLAGTPISFQGGSFKRMYSEVLNEKATGFDAGIHLEQALGVEDRGVFTKVQVTVTFPAKSGDDAELSPMKGTVFLKTMTQDDRAALMAKAEKSQKNMEKIWNTLYILLAIGIIGGYLLIRFVYNPRATQLANFRLAWILSGTRIFYTVVAVGWIAMVWILWKSPVIPGDALSDFGILMISFLPIIFLVIQPLQLDRKYKKCSNCKTYVSPDYLGKQSLGGSHTKHSAKLGDEQIDTGEESHTHSADHFVCPNCGADMSRFYSIHSGGKADVRVGNNGKMSSDIMNTGGLMNFFLTLAQPYNWYRFYRGIGLLK
jgi:hypothetical protein